MSTTKQIKHTDTSGKETVIDFAVDAKNVENNTFTQAATRENIKSGEKLSTIFGKIAKWFTDLKTVAFTAKYTDLTDRPTLGTSTTYGVANNCSTTVANFLLDARQGKVLQDNINQVNSNLMDIGTNVNGNLKTGVNFSSGSMSVLADISLPPGKWIVIATIFQPGNNSISGSVVDVAISGGGSASFICQEQHKWARCQVIGFQKTTTQTVKNIYVTPYGPIPTGGIYCESAYAIKISS